VHASVGHKIVTLDPETGAFRWDGQVYEPQPPESQSFVSAGDAAATEGRVFVPVQTYRNVIAGAGVHSFDVQTGAPGGIVASSAVQVAVPRDGLLVATRSEVIGSGIGAAGYHITDLRGQGRGWTAYVTAGGAPITLSSPAVGADAFYFSGEGQLLAYPLAMPANCGAIPPGSQIVYCPGRWSYRAGANVTQPALTRDGTQVLVGAVDKVDGVDAATGELRWTATLPVDTAPYAPPSADDRFAYVARGGKLFVYERATCAVSSSPCTPIWSTDTGGEVDAQPAIAAGVVYTATTTGVVRAFAAGGCGQATCAHRWETNVGAAVTGGPSISNGHLYIGTIDGRLIAFAPTR
jgi:outer membrane protein assembly factor BamB